MGYAELIETLQKLPEEKQNEVFDFVEYLASRAALNVSTRSEKSQSALAQMRTRPMMVSNFSPMKRDEANVR